MINNNFAQKLYGILFPDCSVKRFVKISFLIVLMFIPIIIYFAKWADVDHYFTYASYVVEGLVPYRDFDFEYPPLSLLFMVIPRLFTSDHDTYCIIQTFQAFIFFAIGVYYVSKIAEMNKTHNGRLLFLLLITLLMANMFVIARNDIYPTVFCIMSFYYFFQKKYTASWIFISLGVMTKIFPLFIAPVLFIPLLLKKDHIAVIKGIIICVSTCLLISLPFIILDPSTAFSYLFYHLDRGLQIESVASSFIMFFNIFDPGIISVGFSYGSHNLVGELPDAVSYMLGYVMPIALLVFFIWALMRIYRMRSDWDSMHVHRIAAVVGLEMIIIFIMFNKVFSAQYIIWVLMLLTITQFYCFNTKIRNELIALAFFYGVFSMINGDFTYDYLVELNNGAVLVVFIRNILHIALMIEVIRLIIIETRTGRINTACEKDCTV
jgi:hypothetical protein